MDKHLPPAPAEERETPVISKIKALEGWHVDDPLSPFVGGEVISRDEVLSVLESALPAEDRAVPLTKGEQYATDEEGHRGTGTPDEEVAQEVRRSQEGDSSLSEHHCQGSRADREVAAEDRAVTAPQEPEPCQTCKLWEREAKEANQRQAEMHREWEETVDELAALTHAIKALRGEMEQKATREENNNWCNTADAPIWRAIHRGRAEVYRELVAILKEWEGRHA
jgi:hypothetical protein